MTTSSTTRKRRTAVRKTTTTARTATSTARSPKPKAAPAAVMPVPAATDAPAAASQADAQAAPMLRKKELIERIVLASGMKKKDVKPVVEATLGVLGQALSQGESLNLPPLGKIVVNRRKDRDDGEVMVARIRRGSAMVAADKEAVDGGNTPLAEAEKES